ncbi:hypothetical protein SAMN06265338_101328 [Rhodoblastus acidophilus]|uniref:Uncharacterized protein n=1 Tax=Rhodoblastus acidophilus TaxID=1074 RepID=A0A212Q253_RHOAC|nr:hypothetical protein [Rhodoblastus acidophilus]PPQ37133.1 hypothetical protein CKO16_15230 [Rhodoblastus acidophilus]RAI17643.1 hypothetical protein CH337_16080 [Rhodoblastus acidophilus]SNB53360.1 hypothetical protein SAMN06265338_101328 [Rhodoblastus acidophilus]
MLSIVILICSIATAPADCRETNALQVVNGGQARTANNCGALAQEALARNALKPAPDREYAKVACLHSKEAR